MSILISRMRNAMPYLFDIKVGYIYFGIKLSYKVNTSWISSRRNTC